MNVEDVRMYCIAKEGATEGFPFGEETLVFKVNEKVFLLMSLLSHPLQFNVKCDPERAIELRGEYDAITPGYHMNKKHWNTVVCDGSIGNKLLKELIDHSYKLVAGGKKAKKK